MPDAGLYSYIEQKYQRGFDSKLALHMKQAQQTIELYLPLSNEFTRVHGADAAKGSVFAGTIDGLIAAYEYTPIDTISAGQFIEGFLYTQDDRVKPGAMVKLKHRDGLDKAFQVLELQELGMVSSVFNKYRVTSVGR